MEYQISYISYPKVEDFVEYLTEQSFETKHLLYDALRSYFRSRSSKIRVRLDERNFNVLVINSHQRKISSLVSRLIEDLKKEKNNVKNVKAYIIEPSENIPLLGKLPPLLDLIQVDKPFNVILAQNVILEKDWKCLVSNVSDKNTLLVLDKEITRRSGKHGQPVFNEDWTECRFLESFHCYTMRFQFNHKCKSKFNEIDISLGDFLDLGSTYNLSLITIEDYLIKVIGRLIDRSKRTLRTSSGMCNILVMCATDKSIEKKYFIDIIRNSIGNDVDINYRTAIYHVGCEIGIESHPFVLRAKLEHINLEGPGFDIVISEFCPNTVVSSALEQINSFLLPGGALIIPEYKYSLEFPGYEKVRSESDSFDVYLKDE